MPVREVDGRYGRIAFFATDIGAIGQSLGLYGEWVEQELSFVRRFIEPGATVIDVGAYIGTHTLAFARYVGQTGTVLAFEPMPQSFSVLQRNVAGNGLSRVRLSNAAVGDRAGAVEVQDLDFAHPASFGSTSLRDQPIASSLPSAGDPAGVERRWVPLITIDSLALPACSLIKIDVEGAEASVIAGAAETLRRLGPVIYAECNTVADGLRTFETLQSLGYIAWLHLVDAFHPDNFFGSKEDVFKGAREAAMVAVPKAAAHVLERIQPRGCEMLLPLATADDLALALLNKPQYEHEVLRTGAAAEHGGARWLDHIAAVKFGKEQAEADALEAKKTVLEQRHWIETTSADLFSQLDALRAEIGGQAVKSDQSANELTARLDVHAEALGRLPARLEAHAEALDGLSSRMEANTESLRQALAESDRRNQRVSAEIADRTALFEAAMRQAQRARDLANEMHGKAAEADSQRHEAITICQEKAEQVDELRRELEAIEADLDAIRRSTSWRMTAPLRAGAVWLRRNRGR